MDEKTKAQIERGRRATEVLKQKQSSPLAMAEQVTIFYALNQGYLDEVKAADIQSWQESWLHFLHEQDKKVLPLITREKDLSEQGEKALEDALKKHAKIFVA